MDDWTFQKEVDQRRRSRAAALQALGVGPNAAPSEIKRAWRRACKRHHPDRNPGDPGARSRFETANCAYRLLAYGEPCGMLLNKAEADRGGPGNGEYNMENTWGLFLWWRERFF